MDHFPTPDGRPKASLTFGEMLMFLEDPIVFYTWVYESLHISQRDVIELPYTRRCELLVEFLRLALDPRSS